MSVGVPMETVKQLGRWSSEAFLRYVRGDSARDMEDQLDLQVFSGTSQEVSATQVTLEYKDLGVEGDYQLEAILAMWTLKDDTESAYLVKWYGYGMDQLSWITASAIPDASTTPSCVGKLGPTALRAVQGCKDMSMVPSFVKTESFPFGKSTVDEPLMCWSPRWRFPASVSPW